VFELFKGKDQKCYDAYWCSARRKERSDDLANNKTIQNLLRKIDKMKVRIKTLEKQLEQKTFNSAEKAADSKPIRPFVQQQPSAPPLPHLQSSKREEEEAAPSKIIIDQNHISV
jgi:hypothetical protein